jgi:hypothetical protein
LRGNGAGRGVDADRDRDARERAYAGTHALGSADPGGRARADTDANGDDRADADRSTLDAIDPDAGRGGTGSDGDRDRWAVADEHASGRRCLESGARGARGA